MVSNNSQGTQDIQGEFEDSRKDEGQAQTNLMAMMDAIKKALTSKREDFKEQLTDGDEKPYRFFLETDLSKLSFEIRGAEISVSQIGVFVLSDAPQDKINHVIAEIKTDLLKALNKDLYKDNQNFETNPNQTNQTTTPNKVIKFFDKNPVQHIDLANLTPADFPILQKALENMVQKELIKSNNSDGRQENAANNGLHISLREVSFSQFFEDGLSGGFKNAAQALNARLRIKKEIALTVSAPHQEQAKNMLQQILPDYKIYVTPQAPQPAPVSKSPAKRVE